MDFCGSNTCENVKKALLGELQARGRYSVYSSAAKEDGYEQIARIFDVTARHEQEHAKIMMRLMNLGNMPSIKQALQNSIEEEQHRWRDTYPEFAKVANNEGFFGIAKLFLRLAEAEKSHGVQFSRLLSNIDTDMVFCKSVTNIWQCTSCGYSIKGKRAPNHCPLCGCPIGFFEIKHDNY